MLLTLPRKIPYKPKIITLILVIVMFGGAAWLFTNNAITNDRGLIINGLIPLDTGGATIFWWVLAVVSALFVGLCILAFIFNASSPKFLELDEQGMTLPATLFRRQPARILYSEIIGLTEQVVSRQRILMIRTAGKNHALAASQLPDRETYDAILEMLTAYLRNAGAR